MSSMQSQTRITPSSKAEVLNLILAYGTRIESPVLEIRGVGTLGTDEVTEFDFRYDCSHHIRREYTYISYPHDSIDEILNVSGLERLSQGGLKNSIFADHLFFLQRWADARAGDGPSSTAGIYFEHTFQNLPQIAHISTLAADVAYGGKIQTRFFHDQPERRLLGFGDQWPPDSQYCLHIRTVWRWVPDSLNTARLSTTRPLQRWEDVVQQAIVERRLGLLTDANVPLNDTSPQAPPRKRSIQSNESWFDLTTPGEAWEGVSRK